MILRTKKDRVGKLSNIFVITYLEIILTLLFRSIFSGMKKCFGIITLPEYCLGVKICLANY